MSKRLKLPPTKSTLLRLKKQVTFLEQGQELLERKRELLTRLVYQYLTNYRQLRKQAKEAIDSAYYWLSITEMRMDNNALDQATLGVSPALGVRILPRRNLGVEYPSVTVTQLPINPVGLMATDPSFDETRQHMADLATILARLGETEMALCRLMDEQRKTLKRVNALKYNIIPTYKETIHFIQDTLEENERETLFQVKVLREREVANQSTT
ncbi:MAG: V-type ATP synthase subunit D [Gammaproteobacteria bacterium]|nr:MAG: V-type ATP synthase subunit D [Gammaproteobacteria bacterium]